LIRPNHEKHAVRESRFPEFAEVGGKGDKAMKGKPIIGVALVIAGVAAVGMTLRPHAVPAAERASPKEDAKVGKDEDKKHAIAVDVVIEEVDLAANTITARSTTYIVPPRGNVGGAAFMMGTMDSPHKEKATKFVRLPVMPEANIKNKKVETGLHMILQLQLMRRGSLVVVGIEEFTGPENVGVEWLDAIGHEDGK
jgi:hypothetical protein